MKRLLTKRKRVMKNEYIALIIFFLASITFAQSTKKSILFLVAPNDFRDEEFKIPYDYLKKAGYKITVASYETTKVRGMLGMEIKPDIKIKDVDMTLFHCLVIIGGSGASIFWDDTLVHKLVRYFARPKKVLAAICLSPITLARAGILKEKKATVWKDAGTIKEFKKRGVQYIDKDVVRAGNILTASGPSASKKFATELAKMLKE